MNQQHYYYGTGRRKTSVARVRLYMERGPIVVNGKPMEEAFNWGSWQDLITLPFRVTDTDGQFRVVAKVSGGGVVSQAGALRHGISRALIVADPALRSGLKKAGLLTRDSREKERKKYGLKRARKAQQIHQTLGLDYSSCISCIVLPSGSENVLTHPPQCSCCGGLINRTPPVRSVSYISCISSTPRFTMIR